MSLPVWPSSLPGFVRDTLSRGTPDGRLVSSMDIGPGKVRRRSKAVAVPMQGDLTCDQTQKETLESFIDTDLLGGVLPFTMTDPFDDQATLVCRFGEELPVFSDYAVDRYKATIQLVVLP
jgi:hypothetical protein